jgi:hypothetical protein
MERKGVWPGMERKKVWQAMGMDPDRGRDAG